MTAEPLARADQARAAGPASPKLGQRYTAGQLPPGSVVTSGTDTEYVIGRTGLCMRWEQPIPGSDTWPVTYAGCLPEGVFMTHRERAEVAEVRERSTSPGDRPAPGMIRFQAFDKTTGELVMQGRDWPEAERKQLMAYVMRWTARGKTRVTLTYPDGTQKTYPKGETAT